MLRRLHIKNVALITEAEIEFGEGLNVLTGETGSGKSVVIECINFVLGAKADKSMIKGGAEECFVEAEFEIDSAVFSDVFDKFGIDEDNIVIVSRKLNVSGRGGIRINGNSVTAAMLKEFTEKLVDVHGQSEHFYLLDEKNQLQLIDSYGKDKIIAIKERLRLVCTEYRTVETQLKQLGGSQSDREIRTDVLTYQIDEIEKADVQEGEEETLKDVRERLINREKIESYLSETVNVLDRDNGAIDLLEQSLSAISYISDLSSEYKNAETRLSGAIEEIKDIKYTLAGLFDSEDDENYTIDQVEERLALIRKIKRKYGADYSEIQKTLRSAYEEREKLSDSDREIAILEEKKSALTAQIFQLSSKLHDARTDFSEKFSRAVLSELTELGMKNARFEIHIERADSGSDSKISANGFDKLSFMFSANLGEELKPLSKIVSGGEISRLMLAIKAQTAKYSEISTFIFDEIDSGIGGQTAKTVAEKLIKISSAAQVIAITHLAQIAAAADVFHLITKSEADGHTHTEITLLDENGILSELARLVGGDPGSANALLHANDLLSKARKTKLSLKNIN